MYHSPDGTYHPKVNQELIATRLTNHSRASGSNSVPGMGRRQSQHQEVSSSRGPLPSGSSFKADDDKWGLLGMLSTLANRSNLNSIHQGVGIDLRTLRLDLASKGSLARTFASPWAEEPLKEEPTWSLPACYNENQPPPVNHAERRASIVCGPHTGNQGMDVSSGYPSLVH